MHKYLIERSVPEIESFSGDQLRELSQASNDVLAQLGPNLQWVESFVTDDKLLCYYYADNEELIREHARRGGFPCDHITVVQTTIDPTTAAEG